MFKKSFLVTFLLVQMGSVAAQTTQPQAATPVQAPPPVRTAQSSLKDVMVPVPVVREVVDGLVNEQRAVILTPQQLEAARNDQNRLRQQNVFQYPNKFIAKPVARSITIRPGSIEAPRMIRLYAGMVTTFVFSDMNGNPWFINQVSFDCSLFNDGITCGDGARKPPAQTNILKIQAQPSQPYAYGNLVVELEGLNDTVMFILSTGQSDENDVKISARIEGRNPNARPEVVVVDRMPEMDPMMGYFLDGVPPPGAVQLKVGGGDASTRAWSLNGSLYLRTRLTVVSPAFKDHAGSADGTHIYKFQSLFPSLLASMNGKTTNLFVSGF